jgi:HK97 family phage major capsid protein
MIDIKSAREEMARIHSEATAHVEKFSADTATATDDEAKAQDARFERMEKLAKQIDDSQKLAKFAFSKEQPVAARAILPAKSADQIAIESPMQVDQSREGYAKAVSEWVRTGEVPEAYATITTTTGSGILLPKIVSAPIFPIKTNVYRRALSALGQSPESYGTTATVASPVITPAAGGAITEGQQNTCGNDNAPSVGVINLAATGYHSGAFWYSNQVLMAETWDVTTSTLPALKAAEDYGFAKAITAAIKADSAITQTTATASISTLTLDNLDALNQLLLVPFDSNKFIILSTAAYNAAETLKDGQGFPIMARNDVQNDHFIAYKGTPVYKDDTLDAFGANNVMGFVISLNGFRMRDEMEKLVQYVNNPCYVDQTGLDYVRYQGFGYIIQAVGKLICPAS